MKGLHQASRSLFFVIVTLAISQVFSQGEQQYYIGHEQVDYHGAQESCRQIYGEKYALAVIQSRDDLNRLNNYLLNYISPLTELWIGGIFNPRRNDWVWDKLIDPSTGESTSFSDYALGEFKRGVPKPKQESMAYYTLIDKYFGTIGSDSGSNTRKYVCEYRPQNKNV